MPTYVSPHGQLIRPRATVTDEVDGLRISIPSRRDRGVLFLVFWLTFWTYAGRRAGRALLHHFTPSLAVWMIAWAFGAVFASYTILYALAGQEAILVNSESLRRTKKIFGLGWSKSYPVREMQNLRFQRGAGRQPSRIAFDYGSRAISFGSYIDEAEACELISRIRQRCVIVDSSAKQESAIKFWQPR